MKLYSKRGWARRAASQLKWHCVDTDPKGRFFVRKMTMEERACSMNAEKFRAVILNIYRPMIEQQLNDLNIFRKLMRV